MNTGNLTIKVWVIALTIFIMLYVLAIGQEKNAKAALKLNKQAKTELTALQTEYLSRTSLSGYNLNKSELSASPEIIYIRKTELTGFPKHKKEDKADKLDIFGF